LRLQITTDYITLRGRVLNHVLRYDDIFHANLITVVEEHHAGQRQQQYRCTAGRSFADAGSNTRLIMITESIAGNTVRIDLIQGVMEGPQEFAPG